MAYEGLVYVVDLIAPIVLGVISQFIYQVYTHGVLVGLNIVGGYTNSFVEKILEVREHAENADGAGKAIWVANNLVTETGNIKLPETAVMAWEVTAQ